MKKLVSVLVAALAIGLGYFTATGGLGDLFSSSAKTENAKIKEAAISATNALGSDKTTGNIPGTNVLETRLPDIPPTTISFENPKFDFGTIDEGDKVSHSFKFTNTGKVPLVISDAKATCGCTVPKWPKEPIAAGESALIDVVFDSSGKPNRQSKRITVTANTNPTETFLEITGDVRGKVVAKGQ